jgi:hypothetical protein
VRVAKLGDTARQASEFSPSRQGEQADWPSVEVNLPGAQGLSREHHTKLRIGRREHFQRQERNRESGGLDIEPGKRGQVGNGGG